jgi:hypothetical protein
MMLNSKLCVNFDHDNDYLQLYGNILLVKQLYHDVLNRYLGTHISTDKYHIISSIIIVLLCDNNGYDNDNRISGKRCDPDEQLFRALREVTALHCT